MATATQIKNGTTNPLTLPYPMRGVLGPGRAVVVPITRAVVNAAFGGVYAGVSDYGGVEISEIAVAANYPFDTFFYGSAGGFAAGVGGVGPELPYDVNSLITGDMTQPEWRTADTGASLEVAAPDRAFDGLGKGAMLLNPTGAAGTLLGGGWEHFFSPPPGVTAAVFEVMASSSTAGQMAIRLALHDAGGNTIITSARFTLNPGAPQLCQLPVSGIVTGTNYAVSIAVNDLSQQAKPYIWPIDYDGSTGPRLRPVGVASGIFAGDFIRMRNSPLLMQQSSLTSFYISWLGPQHSRAADIDLLTDATQFAVECYSNDGAGFTPGADSPQTVAFLVNGQAQSILTPFPVNLGTLETTVPAPVAGPPIRRVTIRSHQVSIQVPGTNVGCYIRSIYLPKGAYVALRQPPSPEVMCIVGDSIELGAVIGSQIPNNQFITWPMMMRKRFPGTVVLDCGSGRALNDDAANLDIPALRAAKSKATRIIVALGANDYGVLGAPVVGLWSAASFGTAYGSFIDKVHAYCPYATVYCYTPPKRSAPLTEVANTFGDALSAYRAAIVTAVSTRTAWARVIDGTAPPMPQIMGSDGVHPDIVGQAGIFWAIIVALQADGAL